MADGRAAGPAVHGEVARQDPFHVAVEDRGPAIKRLGGDGIGRGEADAWQGDEHRWILGKVSPVLVDDGLGAAVEVSCPRVVTKAGPQAQHRVEGRRGEVLECGEGLDKASEIGLYRLHLGLLEHDLREPDAIGRGRAFPGKIVPPFLGEPSQERWSDRRRGAHRPPPSRGFWNRPRRRARAGPFRASGSFSSAAASSAFRRALPSPC